MSTRVGKTASSEWMAGSHSSQRLRVLYLSRCGVVLRELALIAQLLCSTNHRSTMQTPIGIVADAAALAFILYLLKQLHARKSQSPRFPPGPRPLPLIGNLLDFPSQYQHLTFMKWAEKWGASTVSAIAFVLTKETVTAGDIVSVSVFGQRIVVLSTLETATDLLEKKSAVYSDRPYMPMAGELMGWDQIVALSPYGDRFRSIRRLMHQTLGGRGQLDKVSRYHALQEYENHRFLQSLLQNPQDLAEHIKRYLFNVERIFLIETSDNFIFGVLQGIRCHHP